MKKNNKGFTLIEVLVAAAILVIVAIPLLRSFVVSSELNAKSKWALKTTNLAQNLMEGFGALKIEQLALLCNYPEQQFQIIAQKKWDDVTELVEEGIGERKSLVEAKRFEELQASEDEADITSSILSKDGGVNYEFLPKTDGIYYFGLKNIVDQNMGFDALVKVDANSYRGTDDYNSKEIVNVNDMDTLQDAFYIQEANKDEMTANYFAELNRSYVLANPDAISKDKQFFLENINRNISFVVTNTELPGKKNLTKVVMTYEYTCPAKYVAPTQNVYTESHTIYNNSESKVDLRNLYIFYNPLYSSTEGNRKDCINIENEDNVKLKVHIVKQEVVDQQALRSKENQYKMDVKLSDKTTAAQGSSIQLYTNLGTNLDQAYSSEELAKVDQAVYYYKTKDRAYQSDEAKEKLQLTDIADQKTGDYLYDITVKIYKKGAYAKGFNEEDCIATFDGSKLD